MNHSSPTKRIAAIDLGTNSFHAVIVDIYPDGSFRTIDKLKEMVILAEKGMDKHLSEDAMQRGLDALKRIKVLCDSQQVEEILAFATSAIREAKNGGDLIQRIQEEIGIKARAIPGTKEAELIGYAIRHSIALNEEMVLMVDIGGGSVEFIIGNNEEFLYHKSLKLGVARMAARFVKTDPISKEEIKILRKHYKKELNEIGKLLKEYNVKTMIGSSGTMENIGAMVAKRNSHTANMSLNELIFETSEFKSLYKDFIILDRKERKKISQLDEKRIDIINPGMVLVKYLVKKFNLENIKISEAALRDGMILNFIKQERPKLDMVANFPEPRKRSIYELLRKCNWMEAHSKHVAKMALQLFDCFRQELELEERDRELLEYACLLHDIGYYISYRKHHKHALYLIIHSDLKGFTEDEINIMANVARYHRRSFPKKKHFLYKKLEKPLRKKVKKLSALLRVADGLDRSHYQNVEKLEVENATEKVNFYITTMGDPELEIWGAERKSKLFQKVTGKKLEIYAVNKNEPERIQNLTGGNN
ncbi:Ppx/GppA phosphatase family protein [Gramella sp. MAR_2010_147]|uniref:Ppx/GppA phosphatase family protein n=1 Tax=Gramella sp. MAR_2010_147 TaxID=1250205 RepID=UPI00087A34BC|nr:Ppx/GppA phosphatase family protein [Gramella sp. MAR_2010_147]SDS28631.1 exopolyphosphatase / guanosine-5'-triphosphate,3'-diphosphate pyrophosphatase [Gramella sp. MAR_2010_147]